MKKMLAMALTTILALTAVMCGGALAAGSVVARTTDTLQRICMCRTFTRLTRSGPCRPGTR